MDTDMVLIVTCGEPGFQRRLALFELCHLLFDAACRDAIDQRFDKPVEIALCFCEHRLVGVLQRTSFAAQPVQMPGIFLAEDSGQALIHQTMLQAMQDGPLQIGPMHCQLVIAGAFVPGVCAADIDLVEVYEPAAA